MRDILTVTFYLCQNRRRRLQRDQQPAETNKLAFFTVKKKKKNSQIDQCAILSNCHVAISAGGFSEVPKKWLWRSGTRVCGVAFSELFCGEKDYSYLLERAPFSNPPPQQIRVGVN